VRVLDSATIVDPVGKNSQTALEIIIQRLSVKSIQLIAIKAHHVPYSSPLATDSI
jgi:hypothetical protein